MSRNLIFVAAILGTLGCSSQGTEPSDEEIGEARAALLEGITPLSGPFQTVVDFDPAMGDSPENMTILEVEGRDTAFISSLLNGMILRFPLDNPDELTRIPVPGAGPGSFMAGIDRTPDGKVVFAYVAFGQYGPLGTWVKTMNPADNSITDLSYLDATALNGVATHDGSWYAIDPFNPAGVIWKGSLQGGEATPWFQGVAVSPNPEYIPTTCNPPMPVGGNGMRLRVRPAYRYLGISHPEAFMVSNTTRNNISAININADGSAGESAELFSEVPYPDDIWPSRYCGDVFVGHHGLQISTYINPLGYTTEMTQERVVDGPTAVIAHKGRLYITGGGDGLICREGAPTPRIVSAPLMPWLDWICQYSR